ncbi:hypothetical protein VTK26DRAFT_1331 [Humicola hyalothermophila]
MYYMQLMEHEDGIGDFPFRSIRLGQGGDKQVTSGPPYKREYLARPRQERTLHHSFRSFVLCFCSSLSVGPILLPGLGGRRHHVRLVEAHLGPRPVLAVGRHEAHPPHHLDPLLDPPKDGVLAVQPGRRRQRDEELAPVGVGPRVGHAEHPRARVCWVGVWFGWSCPRAWLVEKRRG